jgi:hypothetical protein
MDLVLQAERVDRHGQKITFMSQLGALPVGTIIRLPNAAEPTCYLVHEDRLLAWSPAGYASATPLNRRRQVEVLTPRSVVAVLSAGYHPMLHPSAARS